MKTYLLLAAILALLTGSAAEQPPEGTAVPPPAVTNGQDIALGTNTDEIDLEEMDDSADAAKTAMIKSGNQSGEEVSLIDISCDNATLADILRQFRKVTNANIISDDSTNLQRRVSVNLRRVPWLEGLQSILNSRNYRLEPRGDIYFVKEDKVAEPILTRSFTLNHASSKELADLFNRSFAKKDAKGAVISPIADSFEGANVVVVTATEKVISDCETIIKAVDKAVAQIYIEARFLELSSGALHKLGVQWDSLQSWRVTASAKGGWEFNGGKAASYDSLAPTDIGDATAAGLEAADMGWKSAYGFSGQLSAQDFALALSAFESLGEGRIFSNPKVIVSNGKEANVDMTTKFPNVEVSSQRNTSTSSPYTDISTKIQVIPGDKNKGMFAGDIFYSWGITLSVKPRISPDGLISVEIIPTISQLDTDEVSSSGFYEVGQNDKNTSAYSKFPIIATKRITTEFTMKDGATAVIGGLSKTTEEDIDTGIPYLRKIPWIGQKIFGWKSRQKVQKEIIVCVTIGIANPADLPKDIGLPTNAVMGREYVNGKRLEPGLQEGSARETLKLDLREVDDEERELQPGAVSLKASK